MLEEGEGSGFDVDVFEDCPNESLFEEGSDGLGWSEDHVTQSIVVHGAEEDLVILEQCF